MMEDMEVDEVDCVQKSNDEQDYVPFPESSVKALADYLGYTNIDNAAASLIVQDIDYKITEFMHCASQFMRHCRREKLTTSDVSRAMMYCDVPLVYGHSSAEFPTYVLDKDRDVFYVEDSEVDLYELATTVEEYESAVLPSIEFAWVEDPVVYELEGVNNNPTSVSQVRRTDSAISEELETYYKVVTEAVLGGSANLLTIAMRDLRSNCKVGSLLSRFVKFVCEGVKSEGFDVSKLKNLLRVVDCIIRNESFSLSCSSFAGDIMEVLLHCIEKVFPKFMESDCEHSELQEYAAHLLAKVLFECSSNAADACHQCMHRLSTIIGSFQDHSLSTHLGALSVLIACGPSVTCRILYPHMNNYLAHLNKQLSDWPAQRRNAAQRIFHLLLTAAVMILRFYSEPDKNENLRQGDRDFMGNASHKSMHNSQDRGDILSNSETLLFELYKEFYIHFGDSLTARLPTVFVQKVHFKSHAPLLFPKQLQSAFEVLEEINKKVVSKSSESKSISPDSSPSDLNEGGPEPVSTTVKLVIRKVHSPHNTSPSNSKRKKTSKEKDKETWSWVTQLKVIEKDNSSNSTDMLAKLSSSVVQIKSTSSDASVCRKVATGNIDYSL